MEGDVTIKQPPVLFNKTQKIIEKIRSALGEPFPAVLLEHRRPDSSGMRVGGDDDGRRLQRNQDGSDGLFERGRPSLIHDLSPIDSRDNNKVGVSLDELNRVIKLWNKENNGAAANPYSELYRYVHPLVIGAVDRAYTTACRSC